MLLCWWFAVGQLKSALSILFLPGRNMCGGRDMILYRMQSGQHIAFQSNSLIASRPRLIAYMEAIPAFKSFHPQIGKHYSVK